MAEIRNQDELMSWLDSQPREVCVAIAVRAALRVLPILNQGLTTAEPSRTVSSALILPSLWTTASAAFACRWPNAADGKITLAAADAADAAADYASAPSAYAAAAARAAAHAAFADAAFADAADAAADYAYASAPSAYAAAARAAAYKAISADTDFIETGGSAERLIETRLWPEAHPMPNPIKDAWVDMKKALLELNEDWDVWTRWYEARRVGKPMTQELELARISFPKEDYTNAAVLNPKIKALEDEFKSELLEELADLEEIKAIAEATPLAEKIILRNDGKFDTEFLPVKTLYQGNLDRLSDCLKRCVTGNAFRENSDEVVLLNDMISNHSDDPQRIHDECSFLHEHTLGLIESGVLDDTLHVKRLVDALRLNFSDIRANEPEIQEAIAARSELNFKPDTSLNDSEKSELKANIPPIETISTEKLYEGIEDSVKDVLTIPLGKERVDAVYRLLSRFSRMYVEIDRKHGSAAMTDAARLALVKAHPHLEVLINLLKTYIF